MRALGPMEQGIWKTDLGAPLNFTTVARVSGPLTSQVLRAALPALRERHVHLRSRIVAEGRGATLRDDHVPPLALRVAGGPGASWITELEREINGPVASNPGPLARFTLVEGPAAECWVLATLHHSVGDGLSGAYLMRDLLAACAQVAAGRTPALAPLVDPGAIDDLLPARSRGRAAWPNHARAAFEDLLLRVRGRTLQIRRDRTLFAYDRRARVVHHELEPAFAEALSARARAEKTTVHGALSAAMLFGMLADSGKDGSRFDFASPVNVRPRLEPRVGEDLGFFVSMLLHRGVVRADMPFWELARAVRRRLERELAHGVDLSTLALLPLAVGFMGGDRVEPRTLIERWERSLPATTGLTNLGRLEIEPVHGPFRIEDCHFAASPSALGEFLATATSLGGRIHWNFVWPDPVMTEPHATALVSDIVDRLRRAV